MKFYYMTRVNKDDQIEYFEGMLYKANSNKMKTHWSSHFLGIKSMTVVFHADENGFDEIREVYPDQFIGATIKQIELDTHEPIKE